LKTGPRPSSAVSTVENSSLPSENKSLSSAVILGKGSPNKTGLVATAFHEINPVNASESAAAQILCFMVLPPGRTRSAGFMPRHEFAALSSLVVSNAAAKKVNVGLDNICQRAHFPRSITARGVTGRGRAERRRRDAASGGFPYRPAEAMNRTVMNSIARRLGIRTNPILDALLFVVLVRVLQLRVQPAEFGDFVGRSGDCDRAALRARMLAAIDPDSLFHGGTPLRLLWNCSSARCLPRQCGCRNKSGRRARACSAAAAIIRTRARRRYSRARGLRGRSAASGRRGSCRRGR